MGHDDEPVHEMLSGESEKTVGVIPTRMVEMLTARGGVPGVIKPVTAVTLLEDVTVTLKGVDSVDVALLTAKERAATSDADRVRDESNVDDVDFHSAV